MQLKWNESKSEEKSTILPLGGGGKGKQNGQQFLKLLKTVQKHPYDQNNRLSSFLSIKLPFSQIVFSLNIILYSVLSIMLGDDDIKMKSLILILKQFEEPVRDIANINNAHWLWEQEKGIWPYWRGSRKISLKIVMLGHPEGWVWGKERAGGNRSAKEFPGRSNDLCKENQHRVLVMLRESFCSWKVGAYVCVSWWELKGRISEDKGPWSECAENGTLQKKLQFLFIFIFYIHLYLF